MAYRSQRSAIPIAHNSAITRSNIIKASLMWTIEDFSFHLRDKEIISPRFSAEDDDSTQWSVKLCPSGVDDDSKPWISLFLDLSSCERSGVLARCQMVLMTADHTVVHRGLLQEPCDMQKGGAVGSKYVMERDLLVRNCLPAGDKLTVLCEVSYVANTIPDQRFHIESYKPERVLLTNLGELYKSRMFADVVITLRGKEFHAHKAILAARSSGFRTIFQQDFEGLRTSRVELSHMGEDKLESFLRFIYTGKAKGSQTLKKMNRLLGTIDSFVLGKTTSATESPERSSTKAKEIDSRSLAANFSGTESSNLDENRRPNQLAASIDIENRTTHERPLVGESSLEILPDIAKDLFTIIQRYASEKKTPLPGRSREGSTATPTRNEEDPGQSESSKHLEDGGEHSSTHFSAAAEQSSHAPTIVDMEKFGGKRRNFERWWNEFENTVHERKDLSDIEKFTHLKSLLEGEAARTIANAAYEDHCYHEAIAMLHFVYEEDEKDEEASESEGASTDSEYETGDSFDATDCDPVSGKSERNSDHVGVPESGTDTKDPEIACLSCRYRLLSSECDPMSSTSEDRSRSATAELCWECANDEQLGHSLSSGVQRAPCNENHHDVRSKKGSELPTNDLDDDDDSSSSSYSLCSM